MEIEWVNIDNTIKYLEDLVKNYNCKTAQVNELQATLLNENARHRTEEAQMRREIHKLKEDLSAEKTLSNNLIQKNKHMNKKLKEQKESYKNLEMLKDSQKVWKEQKERFDNLRDVDQSDVYPHISNKKIDGLQYDNGGI